jgi:hypothetical protein
LKPTYLQHLVAATGCQIPSAIYSMDDETGAHRDQNIFADPLCIIGAAMLLQQFT